MAAVPPNDAPRKPGSSDNKLIWIFAGALVLLAGYKLLKDEAPGPVPAPVVSDASAPAAASDPAEMPNSMSVEDAADEKIYTYVEQMPQPPGGMDGLMQYLGKNIKYPSEALRNQVQGKVFVQFVVDTTGRIRNPRITKGIGAGCDEEAVRVISRMPPWTPGKQNGRVVSVSYTVPVTFLLK